MARYFFDCHDGQAFHPDPHGVDIADPNDIPDHGSALARSLLDERAERAGDCAVSVMIRRFDGSPVYVVHCTLNSFWASTDPGA